MREMTNQELATFCDQLYLIIHSGITVLDGIEVMRDDAGTSEAKEILDKIHQELEMTGSLAGALESAEVFPAYMLHMIELGEETGSLEEVFSSLTSYYEREESVAKSIKNAVMYPVIMIGIMFAVVIVLITKVMPVFARVFEQLGTTMGGFSEGILRIGTMMNQYAVVLVILLAVLVGIGLYFSFVKKGRTQIKKLSAKFGPTKKIAEKIACARFADGMAMALSAGLDIEKSMELVAALVEHDELKKKIEEAQKKIAEGEVFSDTIMEIGIFSGVQARMVDLGFKTGASDEVMKKVAAQYEEEIDSSIQSTLSLLEPTLVAVLSVVVGIILLSVMLPLAGIISNIG